MLVLLVAIAGFVVSVAVFAAVAYRRNWLWTGLPADVGDGTPEAPARPAKTMWDWLQLLIVPFVLALAAFGLNLAQGQRDRDEQRRQAKREQDVQNRRAAVERTAAEDRARGDMLRTYLQQMSDLITDHHLRTQPRRQPPTNAQALARTLTLVALRQLDPLRKGHVVQFLMESDLIMEERRGDFLEEARVSIELADLRGATMPLTLSAALSFHPRTGESLRAANFDGADLRDADFRRRAVNGASFQMADLRGADFTDASISGSQYHGACLSGARFVRAQGGTTYPGSPGLGYDAAEFPEAQGRGVDFTDATLTDARFDDAQLSDVKLTGANTRGAKFPRGWTPTGMPMKDAEARKLCAPWSRR
jgi:hypothetical protein